MNLIINNLKQNGCKVKLNENMALHTTFKTGGIAQILCECNNIKSAEFAYRYLYKCNVPFIVLGRCSNVLISDKGFKGVILKFFGDNNISYNGNSIFSVSGGMKCSSAIEFANNCGYSGGEISATIPGSVGGQIVMNAGCFNGQMQDIFYSCDCIIENKKYTLNKNECKFGYRKSIFSEKKCIILNAKLKFYKGDKNKSIEKIKNLKLLRKQSQPMLPSAGSVFKRSNDIIPAKLIDLAGLKGLKCGNAQISNKHSGFIVNTGKATSQDIYNLINKVKNIIYNKYNVNLKEEILYIGNFD